MPERSHLSIGEVLSLLREEFPDVTISKIRFLESQGLVDPERTPSGYRKFYDQDVERLRWILRQQREHFLPLKVIRGRLSEGTGGADNGTGVHRSHTSHTSRPDPADRGETPHLPGLAPPSTATPSAAPASPGGETRRTEVLTHEPSPHRETNVRTGAETAAATATDEGLPGGETQREPARTPAPAPRREPSSPAGPAQRTSAEPTSREAPAPARAHRGHEDHDHESYSADELAAAAGATPELVTELKQYGLIISHTVVAGTPYFDETAMAVTRAAVGFASHGVEARHLRAWRNSADREAALFEQLIMPLLRQRNPQARRQAVDTVADLARLGGELREALLQRALRDIR